jgi:uncharacterized damage-inducible protein DinB
MSIHLPEECLPNRRGFLKFGAVFTACAAAGWNSFATAAQSQESSPWVIGPKPGFSPEIGTLSSMMAFTRMQVLSAVKGLSVADLDFLLDSKANTVGALLNHLAATEAFYQANSFDGYNWDKMPDAVKQKWEMPMNLGEPARKSIKGNSLAYYLDLLTKGREKTLAEFKKRDDKWLMTVDPEFGGNNFGKWFHVAEHESNHNGQIKFLRSRIPGAKPAGE